MKPKTEEFLYLLLWSCESLARPTWRNLTSSFEGWAYRNGLKRQLDRLEQAQFIERAQESQDRLCRLTEKGRLHALGGRDPDAAWERRWDGKWRLVLFDVPAGEDAQRERLRRYLRNKGFGYLQQSVWISPDPLSGEREILSGGKIVVESLMLLEAKPCGGESDEEIVAGAWDFRAINDHYMKYLAVLEQRPADNVLEEPAGKALRQWAARERAAWLSAMTPDPLLPAELLPKDYLGRKAWRARRKILGELARMLNLFNAKS